MYFLSRLSGEQQHSLCEECDGGERQDYGVSMGWRSGTGQSENTSLSCLYFGRSCKISP